MLEYSIDRVQIKVNLSPGIWHLVPDSATGKTYLCNLIKKLKKREKSVFSFTYDDSLVRNLDKELAQGNYELIMLDRYDLYMDTAYETLRECAKTAVILIDCKRADGLIDDGVGVLKMRDSLIEVF